MALSNLLRRTRGPAIATTGPQRAVLKRLDAEAPPAVSGPRAPIRSSAPPVPAEPRVVTVPVVPAGPRLPDWRPSTELIAEHLPLTPTMVQSMPVHGRIGRALKGAVGAIVTGGNPLAGAARGFISAGSSRDRPAPPATPRVTGGRAGSMVPAVVNLVSQGGSAGGGCPGVTQVRVGNRCVDLTALPPGGRPATYAAEGTAVPGAFGLPAFQPSTFEHTMLRCPRGTVLGMDDLCYPKQVLSRRSQWRKWKGAPRPPISNAAVRAIRLRATALERIAELAKDAGLHVTKGAPKPKKK